jgi:DNA-binding MarR family transcriptional regulator
LRNQSRICQDDGRVSSPPPPIEQDAQLLLTAAAAGASEAVVRRLAAAGFGDLRPSHAYVFQHLVHGPLAIKALAARLGMTAQGASKLVLELEQLGYVRRSASAEDRRTHLVELTERGRALIDAGRTARAAFTADVEQLLGPTGLRRLLAMLQRVAEHTGGLDMLASRRLRPPR